MPGTLYIVATPIGNLGDMTLRSVEVLKRVDFVVAEDTRVTLKLLNHIETKKPLISYYEHNFSNGEKILQRLQNGESCALCSDAGMPAISDPGEQIVKEAIALGIPVSPIPGASACVSALAVSGQATDRWVFEGFLPVNRKQKAQRLEALQAETRTIIFYEAPHKLVTTLKDLNDAFGSDRSITLCRELTKLHEEICKTTLGQALEKYAENQPKGEFVLVMAGADPTEQQKDTMTLEQAVALARQLMQEGAKASDAAKQAASAGGFSKRELYQHLINSEDA